MSISVATTRQALATYYSTQCTHAAAHSAAATSANEITATGSARGALSWGSATDNGTVATIVGTATITLPTAGATVDYVGLWSALTGGTFRDGQFDVTNVTYPAGGGSAVVTITYVQS